MKVSVDRAKELDTDQQIDDLVDGFSPTLITDVDYSNWELDGPDVMWSDDVERNAKLEYHLAYLQFWTSPDRQTTEIENVIRNAERIAYHSMTFARIILENLEASGVKLEIK